MPCLNQNMAPTDSAILSGGPLHVVHEFYAGADFFCHRLVYTSGNVELKSPWFLHHEPASLMLYKDTSVFVWMDGQSPTGLDCGVLYGVQAISHQ